MPGKIYEMSGAERQSENVSAVQAKVSFYSKSNDPSGKKNWKNKVPNDLWWKVSLILTIIVLVVLVVYIVSRENKSCSIKRFLNLTVPSKAGKQVSNGAATTKRTEIMDDIEMSDKPECVAGSIKDSYSSFTYQPYGPSEPYRATGLEFPFDAVMKRTTLDLIQLDKMTAATSNIHYYYNIDRCRIGGGLQIDRVPYVKGPIVFAVDQECSKVHYFDDDSTAWKRYRSSRNITCSTHGKHFCAKGGLRWSFSSPKNNISGLEFQYSALAQKLRMFNVKLKPLNFLNNTGPHYFLNMKTCASTDLTDLASIINTRSQLVFAANHECTTVYTFDEVSSTWQMKTVVGPLSCSWKKHTLCRGSVGNSSATFQYTSADYQMPKVLGYQYNFTTLQWKLRSLLTDVNIGTLHNISTTVAKDAKYYLNVDRCLNGGEVNLHISPQIRGPLFFAVNSRCSKVFYFSSTRVQWVAYKTAVNIKC